MREGFADWFANYRSSLEVTVYGTKTSRHEVAGKQLNSGIRISWASSWFHK